MTKRTLKKRLSKKQLVALSRLKIAALDGLGRTGAGILGILPLRSRSVLKQNLNPKGYLDYAERRIAMQVDTVCSFYRLGSCAKEPETVRWIEEQIRPGDVFYDIGANVGAYSFVACVAGESRVRVIAFEPSFATFAQLSKNIFLNNCLDEVLPLCIALGDETKVSEFNYTDLTAGSARHWVSESNGAKEDTRSVVFKQPILSYRLDDLIEQFGLDPPDMIKMDVDGFELQILQGAAKTLQNQRLRSILVEVVIDDQEGSNPIVEYLASKGFILSARYQRGSGNLCNCIFFNSLAKNRDTEVER